MTMRVLLSVCLVVLCLVAGVMAASVARTNIATTRYAVSSTATYGWLCRLTYPPQCEGGQ